MGMEEKKQFLCGVVEGKIGPSATPDVDNTVIIIYFWGGLNTPVIDLYIAVRHFCRWGCTWEWWCVCECVFELEVAKTN